MVWNTNINPTGRVDTGTFNKWLAEKSKPLFRKSLMLAIMQENGNITYNDTAKAFEWGIQHSRRIPAAHDPYSQDSTFPQTNPIATAELPIRMYKLGESVVEIEKLQTGGPEDKMKYIGNITQEVHEDFMEAFPGFLWKDGNATGSDDMHGLLTLFGTTSSPLTNGRVGDVAGEYAGHSMAYGVFGGGWDAPASSAFPYCDDSDKCEYNYHNWTPFHVDVTNTGWASTTNGWYYDWREILSFMFGYMGVLNGNRPDIAIVNTQWLLDCKRSIEDNERFEITQNSLAAKAGFKTVTYEDVEITDDFYCPAGKGVVLTYEKMRLRSLQSQLIGVNEDFNIESDTDRISMKFYGNMQFVEPSAFGLLSELT
jgi:hypothetical protein